MSDPPKLKRVHRLDSIPVSDTYFTAEGYLVDHPIVTSVGIFEYLKGGKIHRELRLPENVFDPESLASYKGKPIIITHQAGEVNKNNVQREAIGTIMSEGYQDGDDVRAEIVIHNTDAMQRSGLKELSLGYSVDLDETPGVWNGQPYDAIQTNIRINHLALVEAARAGEQARLNIDSRDPEILQGGKKVMSVPKKTERRDGAMTPEELQDAVGKFQARKADRLAAANGGGGNPAAAPAAPAQAPAAAPAAAPVPAGAADGEGCTDKVQMVRDRRDRRDSAGDPGTTEEAMGVIAQQDEDIGTLLEVIETLQAEKDFGASAPAATTDGDDTPPSDEPKQDSDDGEGKTLNADSADKLFRERLEVVRLGDKLHMDGLEGMTLVDAKKAIIQKVNPSMRLDGKSPAYIQAAYDLAKETAMARKDTSYQRGQMMNHDGVTKKFAADGAATTGADAARQRMLDRIEENGGKQ